ncbi:MAG: type IX secretion system plug protein domain-containing protein [Saprospiraceae bacterium]
MKYHLTFILLLSFVLLRAAEDKPYNYRNEIYDPYVKTVTLEVNNLPANFPIISLNSGQLVMLKFDDLLNEERTLYYKIIHCGMDWKPSGLREIEYITGFNDERLSNYDYSINTKTPYLHYWQEFPNKDTKFKVSGNYLIVIYEDNIDFPLLSRRFVVSESKVAITINGVFPTDVQNIRYKQEMQVNVNFEKFSMRNPVEEITVVMLQNENWNNTAQSKPSFFSGKNLRFNRVRTFEWLGLAEYREFDTRSLMRLGRNVNNIERRNDGIDVLLSKDEPRSNKVHIATFDFNGRFLIDNFEGVRNRLVTDVLDEYAADTQADANLRQTLRDSLVSSINTRNALLDSDYRPEEQNIRSDYAEVTFVLDRAVNLENNAIYVLGGMNNWQPSEEFKLEYNAQRDIYTTTALLKQGYYNYYYGILDKKGNIDYQSLEGSWNETENDYQALVYYRGLGDIYDRVIGFQTYNTNTDALSLR